MRGKMSCPSAYAAEIVRNGARRASMILRRTWLAAFLVIALPVFFAPAHVLAQDLRISEIAVEGNQRIEAATVRTFLGISEGQTATPGQINQGYQNLLGTGLFETVVIEPQGNRLVVRVQEFPTINRVNFEGNRKLKDEVLEPLIDSRPRVVYRPDVAERDAEQIAEAYRQTGRTAARVRPVIIRRPQNRVDLVFEIREGGETEIERISFVGNRSFSDSRLREELESRQAGLFRRLVRTDTFVADRIEVDKQKLTDFYNDRGFIDFEVLSVTSEFTRERDAFFVTFRVREGLPFKFGQLTTTTDLTAIEPARFDAVRKIRPGNTYSPRLVDDTIARMERLITRDGLTLIKVVPRVTRNDASQTLDVEFFITRGDRVFVERVDVEGNTTTLDRVIRQQLQFIEGDPYNPRALRDAERRLRALDFFEKVETTTTRGSTPEQVIVTIKVVEKPTGSLGLGLSFNTDLGPGASVTFQERNFLGRGQDIRASFDTTGSTKDVSLTFSEPAFLDRDLALGFSVFFREQTDNDNADFETRSIGFTPSLTFPVAEFARLQVRYRVSLDRLEGLNTLNSSPILLRDDGTETTSAVGYTYTFDTRRRGLDPTAGVVLRVNQDVAGLGGSQKYLRSTILAGAERMIFGDSVKLTSTFEGGALVMLEGDSRVTERFFLPSAQMRGFEFRGIGPRDTFAQFDDGLGGNYFIVNRFEAQFPLGLPQEVGMKGGVFYDVGSLWGLDDKNGAGGNKVDDGFALRHVVGVSLFWESALGPLRFDFSHPLKKENEDEDRFFNFAVSTAF